MPSLRFIEDLVGYALKHWLPTLSVSFYRHKIFIKQVSSLIERIL